VTGKKKRLISKKSVRWANRSFEDGKEPGQLYEIKTYIVVEPEYESIQFESPVGSSGGNEEEDGSRQG
jgi:hypothetical protein